MVRTNAHEQSPKQNNYIPSEARGLIKAVDFCDPRKKKMISKLKYLTQIPNIPTNKAKEITIGDIESKKLFDGVDPRATRTNKLKYQNTRSNELSPISSPKNGVMGRADFIINNLSHSNKPPKFTPILLDDRVVKPRFKEDRLETNISPKSPLSPIESFMSTMGRNSVNTVAVESPKFLESNQFSPQNKCLFNSGYNLHTAALHRRQVKWHTQAHKGNGLEVLSPGSSKARRLTEITSNKQDQVLSPILAAKESRINLSPLITINGMNLTTNTDSEISSTLGSPKQFNSVKQRKSINAHRVIQ